MWSYLTPISEGASSTHFCNQNILVVGYENLDESQKIRMIEFPHNGDLILDSPHIAFVGWPLEWLLNHFDSNIGHCISHDTHMNLNKKVFTLDDCPLPISLAKYISS